MSDDITGLCKDHSFESAEAVCRRCGLEFCELCLVYPFGAGRPLCKECAMAEGGVRSHVARAPIGRRELRKKLKAFDNQQARAATNGSGAGGVIRTTEPVLRDPLVPTEEDLERVPAAPPEPPAVEDTAASFDPPPPPPPPPPPTNPEPAEGVAPPIDWSQPFG